MSFLVHGIGLPISRVSLPFDGIALKRALERQDGGLSLFLRSILLFD